MSQLRIVRVVRHGIVWWLKRIRNRLIRLVTRPAGQTFVALPVRVISREELQEIKRHFPMNKYFVLGHARSGTTLLARLLRLHPDVHCNWQAHFFTKQHALTKVFPNTSFKSWLDRPSNRWTSQQQLETSVLRVVCDYIMEREAHKQGKRIVGDKSPDESPEVAVETLHAVYPDVKVIQVIRDGRDAVLSRRMQLFVDAPSMFAPADLEIRDALKRDAEDFYARGRSVFTPSWLEEAASRWALNVHNTDAIARELYGDRYFALRYEDLIAAPVEWLSKIWRLLEAEPPSEEVFQALIEEMDNNPAVDWQQEKAPRIVEGLKRGSAGGWRQVFTEMDRRIFERQAGEELQRWGYDAGVE